MAPRKSVGKETEAEPTPTPAIEVERDEDTSMAVGESEAAAQAPAPQAAIADRDQGMSKKARRRQKELDASDPLPASVELLLGPDGPEREAFIKILDQELKELPERRKYVLGLKKAARDVPKRGLKEALPDMTELQAERISKARVRLFEAMAVPKGSYGRSLIEANWDSENLVAVVTKPRGKLLHSMGFPGPDGMLNLHPEEAAFLVDRGGMELYDNGQMLSIQETFARLLDSGFPLDVFVTYCLLKRMGYIVRRTMLGGGPEGLGLGLGKSGGGGGAKGKGKGKRKTKDETGTEIGEDGEGDEDVDVEMEVEQAEVEHAPPPTQSPSLWSRITSAVKGASQPLNFNLNIGSLLFGSGSTQPILPSLEVGAEEAYAQLRVFNQKSLYDPIPLPLQSGAASAGLNSRSATAAASSTHANRYMRHPAGSTPIHFDIFQPEGGFKKTDPGEPEFRLCVIDYLDPIPALALIRAHTVESTGVPVKYAVCDGGTVTFFGFQTARLKVVVKGGDAQEPQHLINPHTLARDQATAEAKNMAEAEAEVGAASKPAASVAESVGKGKRKRDENRPK